MLSRTLSKQGAQASRGRRRPLLLTGAALGALTGLYLLLPKPAPRIRSVAISDSELRALVGSMQAKTAVMPALRAQVNLGRRLFQATELSPARRSCAGCHAQERDGAAQPATPGVSLANCAQEAWLGKDGHSDSLAAKALASLEDMDAAASSRLHVLQAVRQHYLADFVAAYGDWPEALKGPLPSAGLPAAAELKLPVDLAARALASIGDFKLMETILQAAPAMHIAPAMELSRRAFASPPLPPGWVSNFAALSKPQQQAVNEAFAKVGNALAAYLSGLAAGDAPFDQFAARLAQGRTPQEALGDGFGDSELTGLRLFLGPGQCQSCHSGPLFSDGQFHNVGLAQRGEQLALGRAAGVQRVLADPFNCLGPYLHQEAGQESASCKELPTLSQTDPGMLGAYKTPSLRHSAAHGPYMHDGRYGTLNDVLEFYNELGDKAAVGSRSELLRPLHFTPEETAALRRFLESLRGPVRDLNPP